MLRKGSGESAWKQEGMRALADSHTEGKVREVHMSEEEPAAATVKKVTISVHPPSQKRYSLQPLDVHPTKTEQGLNCTAWFPPDKQLNLLHNYWFLPASIGITSTTCTHFCHKHLYNAFSIALVLPFCTIMVKRLWDQEPFVAFNSKVAKILAWSLHSRGTRKHITEQILQLLHEIGVQNQNLLSIPVALHGLKPSLFQAYHKESCTTLAST